MSVYFNSERNNHYCSPYFVVVANDKELLDLLSRQLKQQGYLAVTDSSNRVEYYIDVRVSNRNSGSLSLSSRILHILQTTNFNYPQKTADYPHFCLARNTLVRLLFHVWHFDAQLIGYSVLKFIAEHSDCDACELKPYNRKIYPQAACYFGCSVKQINRAINYTLRKAEFNGNLSDLLATLRRYLTALAQLPDLVEYLAKHEPDFSPTETAAIKRTLDDKLQTFQALARLQLPHKSA